MLDRLSKLLIESQIRYVSERDLQDAIERLLISESIPYEREYNVAPHGRIDFYFPAERIGLEVKIKDSATKLIRQLLEYAQDDRIGALLLVTTKSRLATMPPMMNGKPVRNVFLWVSGF